jgi:hypothetical protein
MPEKKDNTALLAVGGLAAVGTLGYFFWYAPRVAARRQIEATMLANAKKAQASGAPNWKDQLSSAACIAAAAYYSVPPSISGPLCRKYAPGLVRRAVSDAYTTTKGGVIGTVHGVESAAGSIGGAALGVGKSVAAPFVSVGKSIGNVFSKIF